MASDAANVSEAVPIVAAMACRLADERSVRALLIKGAPATAVGVRSVRPSLDADVWVDPDGFDPYLSELTELGWRRYASQPETVGWGHAVTMSHPGWPCTIDVHRRFPGFLADDATAFEIAWRTRSTARMAHQDLAVPSRVVAAAITVLHAARSTTIEGTHDDLGCALQAARSFSADERHELAQLVGATGAADPLADLLREAACEPPVAAAFDAERLQEWRVRVSVGGEPGGGWLLALRGASWTGRVRLLVAAAKPSVKDYAESRADHTMRGLIRASIYRWRRAARALPGAVRAVREAVAARTG